MNSSTQSLLLFSIIVLIFAYVVSPVHISYVESNSMEPELTGGDIYFVDKDKEVQQGDIVEFSPQNRGVQIVHKVVRINEKGEYITKGIANEYIDQERGIPPVNSVSGVVIENNGSPLVIRLNKQLTQILFSIGPTIASVIILIILCVSKSSQRFVRTNSHLYIRLSCLIVFGTLFICTMSLHSSLLTRISGGSSAILFSIPTEFVYVFVDSETMTISSVVSEESTVFINYETVESQQFATLDMNVYPSVLPHSIVNTLDSINPILASIIISAVPSASLYVLLNTVLVNDLPMR